jgi:hypothetical protein
MTTTDGLADDPATGGERAEDEGPPYGRLDRETAAKCGLWLD